MLAISIRDLRTLPQISGVYEFHDAKGMILYIGKAKNVKKRVSSYFQKKHADVRVSLLVQQIVTVRIIPVNSEFEALLLEAELINQYQPKYNVIWKDDKHYIYIQITDEEFPRIFFARKAEKSHNTFFGPFPSSSIVREILSYLRTIFPYCTQNPTVKKACFYTHIGLCNPCPATIRTYQSGKYLLAKRTYRKNILFIKKLLSGQAKSVQSALQREMERCSIEQQYEKAGEFRNKIEKIDYLLTSFHTPQEYINEPFLFLEESKKEQDELAKILSPFYPAIGKIRRIECYDVSNVSGKFAAGAMTTFVDGLPVKEYYRKFRIRLQSTPNDFAMLSEVLQRRLHHFGWPLPHLIVIDGGKPQLIAIRKIFAKSNISIPFIGLAKAEEEIVIPDKVHFQKIRLRKSASALHLLQRIRDEAHRFSHAYHQHLRLRYLLPKN
ncbi:GIY-YIG nuclease family protein [Candidatus Gottesmanbacteria bacterium]|nr:GIY-YIG nuclease family protein [Candidatus Gottesmanbacteria bacterium]